MKKLELVKMKIGSEDIDETYVDGTLQALCDAVNVLQEMVTSHNRLHGIAPTNELPICDDKGYIKRFYADIFKEITGIEVNKEVTEMTVAEINKALGRTIKIIE